MWIEVFRAGTHTDSAGNTKTWSNEDLDQIVSKYNDQDEHEAPLVIGHPKDNSPAYGWVEKLKRKGDKLLANVKPTVDEFVDWVKKGLYKKISISLYSDHTLRHIGFLGGMPPAVKGLEAVQFNSDESITYEYMANDTSYYVNAIGRLFQNLREWIIDKFDKETADGVIPNYEIDYLQNAEPTPSTEPSYSEPNDNSKQNKGGDDMPTVEELQTQLNEKETELQNFRDENTNLKTKVQDLEKQINGQKELALRKEIEAFVEKRVEEGRLTPAQKDAQVELMMTLAGTEDLEFSEGDETKKISPLELHKEFLKKLPKLVEFGEFAKDGETADMTDPNEIAKKAAEYKEAQAKLGNNISIAQAVTHVTKQGAK